MKFSDLVKNINFTGEADDREISYITHDSRKVKPGTLFIAFKGINSDGHDFIFSAIEKGAIAIIANGRAPSTNKVPILQVENPRKIMSKIATNFFKTDFNHLKMIGITGTNGKTTTTQIINHILKYNQYSSGSLGTLGFDTPTGIQSTNFTTPESIDLHHILDIMKKGGVEYVPMEVSSHAIEMNRVDNIDFKIGIYTNLGFDHLDFHGNEENYFQSKLKLFTNLSSKSIAIINVDDKYANRIIENIKCNFITYGIDNKKADLYIEKYQLGLSSTKAQFFYKNKKYNLETSLVGKFNLHNISASVLCCISLGLNIKDIIKAIKEFSNVPGRFEKFKLPKNNFAIIDYAHSPDAFENVFKNIAIINKENKKIITIFGCGGERDKYKRPKMAKIAEEFSETTIITNDNPRNENENLIINDIVSGFSKNKYKIIKDRKEAINNALQLAQNNLILILGKGIEEYQNIRGDKIPHSDIKIVKEYINANTN